MCEAKGGQTQGAASARRLACQQSSEGLRAACASKEEEVVYSSQIFWFFVRKWKVALFSAVIYAALC